MCLLHSVSFLIQFSIVFLRFKTSCERRKSAYISSSTVCPCVPYVAGRISSCLLCNIKHCNMGWSCESILPNIVDIYFTGLYVILLLLRVPYVSWLDLLLYYPQHYALQHGPAGFRAVKPLTLSPLPETHSTPMHFLIFFCIPGPGPNFF